jgi:hypothetical protein
MTERAEPPDRTIVIDGFGEAYQRRDDIAYNQMFHWWFAGEESPMCWSDVQEYGPVTIVWQPNGTA